MQTLTPCDQKPVASFLWVTMAIACSRLLNEQVGLFSLLIRLDEQADEQAKPEVIVGLISLVGLVLSSGQLVFAMKALIWL